MTLATSLRSDALAAQIRRGKGGVVGTGGKGAVALRFDHQTDEFMSTVWPLVKARNLPASFAVVTHAMENADHMYEPTTTTWAELKAEAQYGFEMWAHSRNHMDPDNAGTTLGQEIVGSGADLAAQGIRCMGWMQCGDPSTYGDPHTSPHGMEDEAGNLIRSNYGLYTGQFDEATRRVIPTYGCYGYNPITIDLLPLATLTAYIDQAIAWGQGLEFNLHSGYLGQSGYLSVADFTTFLDYIVTKRNAGEIVPLSSTGLAFADPTTAHRLDLVTDGGFESASTGSFPYGWGQNSSGSWTIQTDGGHGGSNYLRVPSTGTRATYTMSQVANSSFGGHLFMFDAWVRSVDGADYRVYLKDNNDPTRMNIELYDTLAASPSWTHIRQPFLMPRDTTQFRLEIGRRAGLSVDWDDVHVYAV